MQLDALQSITRQLQTELAQRNPSGTNALSHTPHSIPDKASVQEGELFQVIVIGGTFYKCALYEMRNHQPHLKEAHDGILDTLTTAQVLLTFIEQQVHPSITHLAVNLAFPMEPVTDKATGLLDGILERGSKEHVLEGLVGKPVGTSIEEHLMSARGQKVEVAVTNDTICLLLSGLGTVTENEALAAGIVGTGLNFSYFENPHTAINTEAANFSSFPIPTELKEIDAASTNPGVAYFEKTTAGAYLYQLYNARIKEVEHHSHTITDTRALDDIARSTDLTCAPIAQEILTRSAQLCACAMAAITLHKKRNMTFVMEGSVFWRAWNYQDTVNATVEDLCPDYTIRVVRISESNMLGAAALLTGTHSD